MDLPTYTNIWRIEKRLYKLYDFRLPMPLPISWIAVFCGITIPYVVVLAAIGLPFNHTLLWLYVLPPGVLTWLTTRPVLENKRLPELLVSQLRYLGEPRTWCRLVPLSEKNEIRVYARVWHRAPAYADGGRGARPRRPPGRARPGCRGRLGRPAAPEPRPGTGRGSGPARRTWRDRQGRPDQAPQSAQAGPPRGRTPGWLPSGRRGGQARRPRADHPSRSGPAPTGPPAGTVPLPAARHGTGRSAPGWTRPGELAGPAAAGPAPAAARARADGFGRDLPGTEARDPGPSTEGPRSRRGPLHRLAPRTCCGSSRCGQPLVVPLPASGCDRSRCGRPAADSAAAHRGLPRDAGTAGPRGRPPLGPPGLSPSRAQPLPAPAPGARAGTRRSRVPPAARPPPAPQRRSDPPRGPQCPAPSAGQPRTTDPARPRSAPHRPGPGTRARLRRRSSAP